MTNNMNCSVAEKWWHLLLWSGFDRDWNSEGISFSFSFTFLQVCLIPSCVICHFSYKLLAPLLSKTVLMSSR